MNVPSLWHENTRERLRLLYQETTDDPNLRSSDIQKNRTCLSACMRNKGDNKTKINQTHTHTYTSPPCWEDQCEWHRMTRMTGPDCAVMCNSINTHTHIHTQHEDGTGEGGGEAKKRKKTHKSFKKNMNASRPSGHLSCCCRRNVGNGGELFRKRKKRSQERIGSV